MISEVLLEKELKIIVENSIREDVGDGDHSSLACIKKDSKGRAKLLAKDTGIIAGVEFAKRVFAYVDSTLKITVLIEDGSEVKYGDVILIVEGNSRSILKSERLVLNSMQRMSAIATKTKQYVGLLEGTKAKILDTRKTTPGIRAIEKWAVKIGGGGNHRFALYDMILLKDNHIDFVGGITKAIQQTQNYLKKTGKDLKIVVEVRDLEEIREVLRSNGIHRILMDNFSYEDTRKAVSMINGKCQTESSGRIQKENLRKYAECGVDYISIGELTHSVYNMDLSLKAC